MPFVWRTYADTGEEAAALAAGMAAAPLALPRRSVVGIASPNCSEWLITDWACVFSDFISVGIHIHWDQSKLCHVLCDSGCVCCVADGGVVAARGACANQQHFHAIGALAI